MQLNVAGPAFRRQRCSTTAASAADAVRRVHGGGLLRPDASRLGRTQDLDPDPVDDDPV